MLLCDLFYLPFEHGSKALQLLADFHWLKTNASVLSRHNRNNSAAGSSGSKNAAVCKNSLNVCGADEQLNCTSSAVKVTDIKDSGKRSEVQEWLRRSESFENLCQNIFQLARKIARCVNKELCYDLFSYVWDIVAVLSLLSAFIKWLALGHFPENVSSFTQGGYTCKCLSPHPHSFMLI